jgi:hypothetical protein
MALIWSIISIILIVLMYKRSPKYLLVIVGTLLGSIIYSLGVIGLFSGISNILRTLSSVATTDIYNSILEGTRIIKIPFSIGTILTVIFFGILSLLISVKKARFNKWSLWAGFLIFFVFTFSFSYNRYSLMADLLTGFGKLMEPDTVQRVFSPLLRTGRIPFITALSLSLVYLLVAILFTFHKPKKETPVEKPEQEEKKEGA